MKQSIWMCCSVSLPQMKTVNDFTNIHEERHTINLFKQEVQRTERSSHQEKHIPAPKLKIARKQYSLSGQNGHLGLTYICCLRGRQKCPEMCSFRLWRIARRHNYKKIVKITPQSAKMAQYVFFWGVWRIGRRHSFSTSGTGA